MYMNIHICIYMYVYIYPPDSINDPCSLPDCQISGNCLNCHSVRSVQILCGGTDAPGSDPLHKIMRYWFYYPTWLASSFPPNQNGRVKMFCTT